MKNNKWVAAGVLAVAAYCQVANAAVSVQEAEKLKNVLTPMGAERAGNGSDIPPWRGGLTAPTLDYKKAGQHHTNPFPQDKPLFTITAENKDQYKAQREKDDKIKKASDLNFGDILKETAAEFLKGDFTHLDARSRQEKAAENLKKWREKNKQAEKVYEDYKAHSGPGGKSKSKRK